MDFRRSETPFRPSTDTIIEEPNPTIDAELDVCNEIISKPALLRTPLEVETFVNKITSLEIFGRTILENLDSRTVIKKLMPSMKPEFFAAGKPIFHYEQPADKMYILLRGKAKEFVPKGIDEIEEESHCRYGGFQYLQGVPISMPELTKCETLPSVSSSQLAQQKGQYASLNTISEENEEDNGASELTKKRLRKLKAVLPFLKKLNTNKNSVQCAEEYRYKRTIKKMRSILKPSVIDEEINVEALERELGCHVADEFKKYPRQYFIGGILKVHFSKYLYPGAHCGLRALRDNSLRSRAVFAEEDCHCISLSREDFMTVLENEKALNIDKIEFFKKMFSAVDEKTAIEFALLWENHPCKTNDTIFQQNEQSNCLYVLCSGEVMLSKTISQNQKSKAITADLPYRIKRKVNPNEHMLRVATICSGDFFGEEDFFDEKPREFTAVVSSTKVKVYKLQHEKYKNLCKNYSEIIKEIRKWMALKTDWKKERLEELYQHHTSLQEKSEVKDGRREQEKNLIALGLLSPELQPSSLRLKMKLLEKTKVANPGLNNEIKLSKSIIDIAKSPEKALEAMKENFRKGIDEGEELFSRTKIPRQYDQKHDGFLKQNNEIFKLEFRETEPMKKSQSKKLDSCNQEPRRPYSQSRDRGILSSPSLRMVKRRFLKDKKVTGAATIGVLDSKDSKDPFVGIPSLDLDLKIQSQELLHNTSLTFLAPANSVQEKNYRQTVMGPFITQNNNVTSLDKLDKPEKGSLATTDVTSRQTLQPLSRTLIDSRSLSRLGLGEDISIAKGMTINSPQLKSRASLKNLRLNIARKENANQLDENGKENLENHKAFKILGEKAKALGIHLKRWAPSVKNGKCIPVLNIHSQSQL